MSDAYISAARVAELLQKVLQTLASNSEPLPAKKVIQRVAELAPPTEYEQSTSSSGRVRYDSMIYFKSTALLRAGLIFKEDGGWSITPEGLETLKQFQTQKSLYTEIHRRYYAWKKGTKSGVLKIVEALESEEATTDEEVSGPRVIFEQAQSDSTQTLNDFFTNIHPYEFQKLVGDLLKAMGYSILWDASTPGPDGGVDIIACVDPLGSKQRIKVQVKRYASPVGVKDLRSFIGKIDHGGTGLFVSTGGFTTDSIREARELHDKWLTLIDQNKFFELWVQHYSKLDADAKSRLPIKAVYFYVPDE